MLIVPIKKRRAALSVTQSSRGIAFIKSPDKNKDTAKKTVPIKLIIKAEEKGILIFEIPYVIAVANASVQSAITSRKDISKKIPPHDSICRGGF